MSQKLVTNQKQFRPSSSSTVVSSNPQQIVNNLKCQNKMITLRSIILQATKILANQPYITQQDLQIVKKSQTVNDVLLFIRYMSNKSLKKCEKVPENKSSLCSEHQHEIYQLKQEIQKKRSIIVKLNEGYQEAKKYFQEQLKSKDITIGIIKKQICQVKSENEILKQKVQTLQNFRERRAKDVQRVKLQSARNKKAEVQEDVNQKIYYSQNNSVCYRDGSQQSRKSQYQQLKDILEIMSFKLQNMSEGQLKSPSRSTISKKSSHLQPHSLKTTPKKTSLNFPFTPNTSTIHLARRQTMGLTGQQEKQFPPDLFKQVRELRQNQSKLLDKICEKDQIINDLIKIKGSNSTQIHEISYRRQ